MLPFHYRGGSVSGFDNFTRQSRRQWTHNKPNSNPNHGYKLCRYALAHIGNDHFCNRLTDIHSLDYTVHHIVVWRRDRVRHIGCCYNDLTGSHNPGCSGRRPFDDTNRDFPHGQDMCRGYRRLHWHTYDLASNLHLRGALGNKNKGKDRDRLGDTISSRDR